MVYQVEILSLAAGAPHQLYQLHHQAAEGSVLKPAPFTYHVAHDVAEAVALLTDLGEDAKVLAGGQSLVPMMNLRLARPSALVDITRIPGLDYLRAGPDGLHIGALTRHRAVETTQDPAVLAGFGVLQRSARWIGHYPIRSRGTFGGSVAHGDSTAEWCILAVLLGAQIILAGPGGQRQVGAGDREPGRVPADGQDDPVRGPGPAVARGHRARPGEADRAEMLDQVDAVPADMARHVLLLVGIAGHPLAVGKHGGQVGDGRRTGQAELRPG